MSAQQNEADVSRPAPLYPFLSRPPPPQKKRPTKPLPSLPNEVRGVASPVRPPLGRRRSATMSAITSWAAEVLPGTPAPWSPRRSPSMCSGHRTSLSRASRRGSIGSGNKGIITPIIRDIEPDHLTAVGYTSVFIHFSHTPLSPPSSYRPPHAAPTSPVKSSTKHGLKHFKSLSALKCSKRGRSKAPPPSPILSSKSSYEAKRSRALHNAAVARSKLCKYSKLRPAPLANELALAQLMDGGSVDDHVRRFVDVQAKANGAKKINGQLVGVGDVYRDGEGGVWLDQDEEWEFAHLLGGDEDFCMGEDDWVHFDAGAMDVDIRQSLSTQDSDLSPRYAMQTDVDLQNDPVDLEPASTLIKPGLSVLAIPARSRRTAKHLRKPEFLLDVFPVPRSPTKIVTVPRSPRSPRFVAFSADTRTRGTARRRPTPLALVPPSPGSKRPSNPADPDETRREFFQDSFAPRPRIGRTPRQTLPPAPSANTDVPVPRKIMTKSSIANMKGFFRSIGSKKP